MPRPSRSIAQRQQIADALEAEFLRSADGSEQWRDVVGWETAYQISNSGRVRSKSRLATTKRGVTLVKGQFIKPILSDKGDGYWVWNATSFGRREQVHIHRAILFAFVGEPPVGKDWACHRDGDSRHNHLQNLRWDTPQGNSDDAVEHGTIARGERVRTAKLTEEAVRKIRAGGGIQDHMREFGVSEGCVQKARYGTTWKHV